MLAAFAAAPAHAGDANAKFGSPAGQSFSASYDGLDRMKGVDVGAVQGAGTLTTIGYDNAGRRSGLTLELR